MKKKALILSAVFLLFLVIGLWYNLTPGRYYDDDFWKLKNGEYTSWDNRIRQSGESFELTLGGRELTAALSETDAGYRVDFSDGWAVELDALDPHIWLNVGGMLFSGDSTYILTDMDKAGLRFGSVVREVRDPFDGEDGKAVGESIYLETETGESVGWREVWFDRPEMSSPEQETVLLENGARLTSDEFRRNLYVNADDITVIVILEGSEESVCLNDDLLLLRAGCGCECECCEHHYRKHHCNDLFHFFILLNE